MRTLRLSLAGTLCLVVAAVLPAAVVAQGDDPADATSDPPAEVTVMKDLVYATGRSPDEVTELTLVAYLAPESEDAPMVVDLQWTLNPQTGAWQRLAERGVSVFVARFRDRWPEIQQRADPTAYRVMAEAVACAVRFARGSEYGSETAPLVLTGFSRYGGLATHVALAGEDFDRVWEEYEASGGAPPAQYDCTVGEASTRVDGLVSIAGPFERYVGHEAPFGRDWLLEREPDLWEMLWGTVGLHTELRVRLLHGDADSVIPLEVSARFEAVLAEAGYDVELVEFEGIHIVPPDLVTETVMDLFQ